MRHNILSILLLVGILVISACHKHDDDHDDHNNTKGAVTLKMDHRFLSQSFRADSVTTYTLPNGEALKFTQFRYYISNIQLKAKNGTWWSQPESYHIVNAGQTSPVLVINDAPTGEYTDIKFTFGVDSTRNVSGAQEGALSPSNDMFWSWNSGYIFIKSEGTCEQIADDNKTFIHHVGGFRTENSAVREMTFNFGQDLRARPDGAPSVHLHIQVDKMYQNTVHPIDVKDLVRLHMPGTNAVKLADNIANMFELDHIHN